MHAWRFYKAQTQDLLRSVGRDPRWRTWLAVTPDRFAKHGRFWPSGFRRVPQGFGDLGKRMMRPFVELPPGPIVLIGSDIPGVTSQHVAHAFQAAERSDIVFGPAADGGFWLVAMNRRRHRSPRFGNIPWSVPETMDSAIDAVPAHWKIIMADTMNDIDTGADWERHLKLSAQETTGAET